MTVPGTALRLGPSRARVLDALWSAEGPRTSLEVATAVGTHPNSARFHLEALVEDGLVERRLEDRSTRGRPRVVYTPVPQAPLDPAAAYRELAGMLAAAVVERAPTPSVAAQSVGARRGRQLVSEPRRQASGREGGGREAAAEGVVRTLGRYGFESRSRSTRTGGRIDITPCPFLPLARQHADVVCSLHRGLVDGVLAGLGAPVVVADLVPFERPDLCVVHLRRVKELEPG